MRCRKRLPNGAAGRVADEMSPFDLEVIHEREQVGGHLIDGIADARPAALPIPGDRGL
jgi:hypothetical protein